MSSRPSRGAARLAAILDALPDALVLVNANGTVVNANAMALETLEVHGTALVGRGLLDLLPGFDSRLIPGSMRRPDSTDQRGRTKPTRMTARRTDGSELPVEVTSANLERLEAVRESYESAYDSYGRDAYASYDAPAYTGDELLMLVVRDLTGTVDTESELARSQQQTEIILRAAAEGVVGTDNEGRVVLVNPAAAQILGYRAGELGGKELHALALHSRADGSPFPYPESALADSLRSGRKHRVRGQVMWTKKGTKVPVDLTTAPVREGDELVGAVMTFTDRSAYDQLAQQKEEEAARHAEEVARLHTEHADELDRIREEHAAELATTREQHAEQYAEVVEAHEEQLGAEKERYAALAEREKDRYEALDQRHEQLLAVLGTSLRGPIDQLGRELANLAADDGAQLWPEAHQILHHLAAGYARITTLVDNVLNYQRLDAGNELLSKRPALIDQVITAGVDGAVELIGPGRAQFAVHAPPLEAEVDAERLATALAHLVADVAGVDATGNAPAGVGGGYGDSTIVVAAAQRGDVVRIEVRGPYAGGDLVHEPIVRGIVRAHGGVLQTHEVPGMSGRAYVLEVPIGGNPRDGFGAVPQDDFGAAAQAGTGTDGYTDDGYGSGSYTDTGYADGTYADGGYEGDGYPEGDYPESGCPENDYPESGCPEGDSAGDGHPEPAGEDFAAAGDPAGGSGAPGEGSGDAGTSGAAPASGTGAAAPRGRRRARRASVDAFLGSGSDDDGGAGHAENTAAADGSDGSGGSGTALPALPAAASGDDTGGDPPTGRRRRRRAKAPAEEELQPGTPPVPAAGTGRRRGRPAEPAAPGSEAPEAAAASCAPVPPQGAPAPTGRRARRQNTGRPALPAARAALPPAAAPAAAAPGGRDGGADDPGQQGAPEQGGDAQPQRSARRALAAALKAAQAQETAPTGQGRTRQSQTSQSQTPQGQHGKGQNGQGRPAPPRAAFALPPAEADRGPRQESSSGSHAAVLHDPTQDHTPLAPHPVEHPEDDRAPDQAGTPGRLPAPAPADGVVSPAPAALPQQATSGGGGRAPAHGRAAQGGQPAQGAPGGAPAEAHSRVPGPRVDPRVAAAPAHDPRQEAAPGTPEPDAHAPADASATTGAHRAPSGAPAAAQGGGAQGTGARALRPAARQGVQTPQAPDPDSTQGRAFSVRTLGQGVPFGHKVAEQSSRGGHRTPAEDQPSVSPLVRQPSHLPPRGSQQPQQPAGRQQAASQSAQTPQAPQAPQSAQAAQSVQAARPSPTAAHSAQSAQPAQSTQAAQAPQTTQAPQMPSAQPRPAQGAPQQSAGSGQQLAPARRRKLGTRDSADASEGGRAGSGPAAASGRTGALPHGTKGAGGAPTGASSRLPARARQSAPPAGSVPGAPGVPTPPPPHANTRLSSSASEGAGRSYAIGAPDRNAAEGPEPLDGPGGAVEISDQPHPQPLDDELPPEPLDNPRRLLVWPAPDAVTQQALDERGYRPVIVHSRAEVDAQIAAFPAALFVDPLTGPITRKALQSLREAAVAAEVPVMVTAGLGQASRDTAYGADPAVLLKALAPRDSEQHPPRVLLIEEHTEIAAALTAALERRGLQVACAQKDTDAVHLAAQLRPNLVVTDLMQVRRGSAGIVDWLRANGQLNRTPLVVYTAAVDPAELPRLAAGETVLFLAERATTPDVQTRIVDLLSRIGTN